MAHAAWVGDGFCDDGELPREDYYGSEVDVADFSCDAFPDEAGRQAHLSGKVAAALMEKAGDLFATPPSIEKVDVLAAKLPG